LFRPAAHEPQGGQSEHRIRKNSGADTEKNHEQQTATEPAQTDEGSRPMSDFHDALAILGLDDAEAPEPEEFAPVTVMSPRGALVVDHRSREAELARRGTFVGKAIVALEAIGDTSPEAQEVIRRLHAEANEWRLAQ
jgi:hypothetical protein